MFMNMKRIINFSSSFFGVFTMFFCILLVGVFPFFIKGIHLFHYYFLCCLLFCSYPNETNSLNKMKKQLKFKLTDRHEFFQQFICNLGSIVLMLLNNTLRA